MTGEVKIQIKYNRTQCTHILTWRAHIHDLSRTLYRVQRRNGFSQRANGAHEITWCQHVKRQRLAKQNIKKIVFDRHQRSKEVYVPQMTIFFQKLPSSSETRIAIVWKQFGICFIVFYHYLFDQMPDILGAVPQIQNSSNNMLILQSQNIATTSCNESSHDFLIPSYPSKCSARGSFTVWRAVKDEGPLREVLTPAARFFMLHVHTL